MKDKHKGQQSNSSKKLTNRRDSEQILNSLAVRLIFSL